MEVMNLTHTHTQKLGIFFLCIFLSSLYNNPFFQEGTNVANDFSIQKLDEYNRIPKLQTYPVVDNTVFPSSAVAHISSVIGGLNYLGAGIMISPYHVLVSPAILYSHGTQEYTSSLNIYLEKDKANLPSGMVGYKNYRIYDDWVLGENSLSNMALNFGIITLDRRIGDETGYFELPTINTIADSKYSEQIYVMGYDIDLDFGNTLNYDYNTNGVDTITQDDFQIEVSLFNAVRGSPVYHKLSTSNIRTLLGILVGFVGGSPDIKIIARLHESKSAELNNWINEDDSALKSIEVTAPDTTTKLSANENYTIKWNTSVYVGNVSISLTKNGVNIDTLTANVANTGSFSWTVADDLDSGDDYAIKVADIKNNSIANSSALFKISSGFLGNLANIIPYYPYSLIGAGAIIIGLVFILILRKKK